MGNEKIRKLKRTVYLMMALGVITFLSGFLKYTPFEHISLLLFFLLFLGGVKLFYGAAHTELNGYTKFFLIMTGIATILFMVLMAVAIFKTLISEVTLSDNLEFLEGLFYLASLIFLVGIIGCIIILNINGGRSSRQA